MVRWHKSEVDLETYKERHDYKLKGAICIRYDEWVKRQTRKVVTFKGQNKVSQEWGSALKEGFRASSSNRMWVRAIRKARW